VRIRSRLLVSGDGTDWRQCHGSTFAVSGGRVIVAWFAGGREGAADCAVWLTAQEEDGHWSRPRPVLGAEDDHPWWNPVLFAAPDGRLLLFAHRGRRISSWQTWVAESADAGRTWSHPRELVPGDRGGRGPVKNPPVVTPQGTWLAPASIESGTVPARWDSFFDRSEDAGRTWSAVPVPLDHDALPGAGAIQPAVWCEGERAVALLRTSGRRAFRTTSDDDGLSWAPAQPIDLPQNNSGLHVASLPGTGAVLACNPVADEWGPRCPLSLATSTDEGRTWQLRLDLDDGSMPPDPLEGVPLPALPQQTPDGFTPGDAGIVTNGLGEYSYPTVAVDGSRVLVSYTWQRRGIVLAEVELGDDDAFGSDTQIKSP
jgi:predicted neuraminidase